MFKILLALTNTDDVERLSSYLSAQSISVDHALNGKDAQLMSYNVRYSAVILDMALVHHSAFEVLRYYKVNRPTMKVVAWVKDPAVLQRWEVGEKELHDMGVNILLQGMPDLVEFHKSISGNLEFQSWKKVDSVETNPQSEGIEGNIPDGEFTPLRLVDFISGNTSFFDFYVRLTENRYVKVLHKGEKFLEEQMQRYQKTDKLEFLYFKNTDRRQYINYMNELTQKIFTLDKASVKSKATLTKNLLDKYVEEVYVQGLPPDLYEEGQAACKRVVKLLEKDKDLTILMRSFEDTDPASMGHCTLTTFYAAAITKNLDWGSDQIVEKVTMGAILHDIGKLKLPKELQEKRPVNMTAEEFQQYKQHSQWGYDLVKDIKYVPMPVKQIIHQHHELADGTGYPHGLQGLSIYPPAKIVAFANFFSHYLVDQKMKPLDAFHKLLKNRDVINLFDADVVKALIKGFIIRG